MYQSMEFFFFFLTCQQKTKKKYTKKLLRLHSKNNDYTTGNLLDYGYFSKHYKLIAIDLMKQIELENSDLKQQINFFWQTLR